MSCNGIHEGLKATIQEEMFLFLDLAINDNDAFLENVLCIIGGTTIGDNKVMDGGVIVFIDILQYAVIAGLNPLYNFLNRKFTHFIACSGVLGHKTKKKTLTAWKSKDIFDVLGRFTDALYELC
jgi:hypothetical protein